MSDVDELNSDLDEYDPTEDDDNTFRVRDALEPPRQHPMSTQDLHALIHQGLVDLNPSYQRDVVWPEAKQIGLIDSIFRNFYIPPVIFAVQKDEDGEEVRTCVDGKQRLTSISKFMDDRDPVTKKKYWYTRSENQSKTRLELPEPYKKQFQRKQITCGKTKPFVEITVNDRFGVTVEYFGLVPGTERDIFQRVQLGMSLTAAEKLQAISSPLAQWISNLQTMWVSTEGGMTDQLKWDTSRGRDFQGIAQLCFCCWHLPAFSMPSLPKVEKWLNGNSKPSAKFKVQVSDVLRSFLHIATKEEYRKAFTKIDARVAPVEFVFIGILLAKMRDCSWPDRADQVYNLRTYTRALHKDVRSNERVMKSMWSFVEKVKTPYPDPYKTWETPGVETEAPKKKPSQKRKRNDGEGDDESFRPRPVKGNGRTPKTRSKVEKEVFPTGVPFVA